MYSQDVLRLGRKTMFKKLRAWWTNRKMKAMFDKALQEANEEGKFFDDDTVIPKTSASRNRRTVAQDATLVRDVESILAANKQSLDKE